jgi:large conductance mechanosensitive channel
MLKEFKDFIAKGNVMDLAVGIIIGAAFTAIVTSLVDDLIQPIIGMILGGIDFSTVGITVGTAYLAIGNFITAGINFVIIAFVVFMLVRTVNKMKAEAPAEAAEEPKGPTELEVLLEIRNSLAK